MVGADQQRLAFARAMFRIVSEDEAGAPCDLALVAQDSRR